MALRKTTLVVADDDPQILKLITRNLQLEGYATHTATNGQEALEAITSTQPDAVLLDVMMPKLDGFAVCQQVRQFSAVPIILITARGNDQDKVHGLDSGADDYLTKPFSVDELLARVRAVLRRATLSQVTQASGELPPLRIGGVQIDFAQHQVTRDDIEISLTPTEYQLCIYLAQNAGRVLTQNMLLDHVWGAEYTGEHHMLQVNVNRLRRKLEADPTQPHYILTKSGVGYLFAAHPQPE
ncbi:MAG: response regulator transcription factor [Ktedonobacterales bacterium]|nr:response regulator transcription factor [Ktedonobacterales bacterium]